MSSRVIDLGSTSIKAALKIMMAESGINSLAQVARKLEINETTFRAAITNKSLRLNDFLKIAEFMEYKVIIQSNE
ncbi:MAG: helix-turn-helix domain-containing protein [Candidatus Pristimantibacillus sp.]